MDWLRFAIDFYTRFEVLHLLRKARPKMDYATKVLRKIVRNEGPGRTFLG